MENITDAFKVYKNKKVLITGHTGFKGSWLASWLHSLGAEVIGYSLPALTTPAHINLLKLPIKHFEGNILDLENLKKVCNETQPEIIFHLAAQSLVRESYKNPIETYNTNVMGTLHVFEAARQSKSVRAIVNVTSDKCYENKEWDWGYRESDPMGGYDPYSSSKGCSEILTASYRRSFFNNETYGKTHDVLLASARAGNVIGGGDWSNDRLIPDLIRAFFENKKALEIRNPKAIRPWQHVLEPLRGYLMLGKELLAGNKNFASAFNFGPEESNCVNVETILSQASKWIKGLQIECKTSDLHEAHFLKLDSSMSKNNLHWFPRLNLEKTIEMTAKWYQAYYVDHALVTSVQIKEYESLWKN